MGSSCHSKPVTGEPPGPQEPTDTGGKDPFIDGPIFVKDSAPLKSQRDRTPTEKENDNLTPSKVGLHVLPKME